MAPQKIRFLFNGIPFSLKASRVHIIYNLSFSAFHMRISYICEELYSSCHCSHIESGICCTLLSAYVAHQTIKTRKERWNAAYMKAVGRLETIIAELNN